MSASTAAALPTPFYEFFVYVEPLLTYAGAIYAWTMPRIYHGELLPEAFFTANRKLPRSIATDETTMAIRQLGNCYCLLATMSFFLIPAILKSGIPPSHATRILRTFFGVLAVADITHIVCTLIDLKHLAFRPAAWNTLVHGNTTLVVGLFAWRMAYFISSSRRTHPGPDTKKQN